MAPARRRLRLRKAGLLVPVHGLQELVVVLTKLFDPGRPFEGFVLVYIGAQGGGFRDADQEWGGLAQEDVARKGFRRASIAHNHPVGFLMVPVRRATGAR